MGEWEPGHRDCGSAGLHQRAVGPCSATRGLLSVQPEPCREPALTHLVQRQVGEDVLFMREIGSGFRKDGLKYEDITQDLPRESFRMSLART